MKKLKLVLQGKRVEIKQFSSCAVHCTDIQFRAYELQYNPHLINVNQSVF